jgi:arylsulfatase
MTGMAKGTKPNGKPFKAHLDGYKFLPFFKDDIKECPREEYFYSGMGGRTECHTLE